MTVESTAHARTDDVFEVKVGLPTRDAAGESFTVGAGTETSVLALAETIRTVADSDSAIVHEDAH
jgi:UDP-glucose 4-epimerase